MTNDSDLDFIFDFEPRLKKEWPEVLQAINKFGTLCATTGSDLWFLRDKLNDSAWGVRDAIGAVLGCFRAGQVREKTTTPPAVEARYRHAEQADCQRRDLDRAVSNLRIKCFQFAQHTEHAWQQKLDSFTDIPDWQRFYNTSENQDLRMSVMEDGCLQRAESLLHAMDEVLGRCSD